MKASSWVFVTQGHILFETCSLMVLVRSSILLLIFVAFVPLFVEVFHFSQFCKVSYFLVHWRLSWFYHLVSLLISISPGTFLLILGPFLVLLFWLLLFLTFLLVLSCSSNWYYPSCTGDFKFQISVPILKVNFIKKSST